jgi:VCBS repeat-containing protein
VTVTVALVNAAPVANSAGYTFNEDFSLSSTLSASDADSDPLTFLAGSVAPAHGSVVIRPNGSFVYTPDANYHGTDSFSFKANDGTVNSSEATVTLTVNSVNDAPIGTSTAFTISKNVALNGTLTGSDVDGDTLTFAAGSVAAAHGAAIIHADGTFTYTPATDYVGPDTFTYLVNDGTVNSAERLVTITVANNHVPVANASTVTTDEDTTLNGSLTGSDSDLDSLTFHAGSVSPAHGTLTVNSDGTFNYVPAANFHGTDSFSFKVNDGTSDSAEATVTVTVNSVNDAPVATASTATISKNRELTGTLSGSDVDGDSLNFTAGSVVAAHGTVVVNSNGSYTYTPVTDYVGPDSFSFLVNDGTVNSSEATVTVSVADNVPPTATAATATTNEDTPLNGTLTGSDADNNPLTFQAGTVGPAHGSVAISSTGAYIYTPAANYFGTDSFTFVANDGVSDSAEATVTITVAPVNDAPVANGGTFTINEDGSLTGNLTGSDVEGSTLTFLAGAVTPTHGTLQINTDGSFTYTPAANFNGTDTFSYKVNDGSLDSSDTTVTVTVNAVNDAPTVANGSASVNQDVVLTGSVSPLGQDIDGNALTYVVGVAPAHGTLALSPDGTFTYTPAAGFSGSDSFTFKANDGQADSNVATFSLTVNAVEVPLTLSLPSSPAEVARNSNRVSIDPAASVSDPDTVVDYSNARIEVAITGGSDPSDIKNNRVFLTLETQGSGAGLVKIKGSKIYFDGAKTSIASFTGGKKGDPLVITFNSGATEEAVNAVLKQISIQASKKAVAGTRTMSFEVQAGGQLAEGTQSAVIV